MFIPAVKTEINLCEMCQTHKLRSTYLFIIILENIYLLRSGKSDNCRPEDSRESPAIMRAVCEWNFMRIKADLEFIILHHSEEGSVLPAGRIDYAAQGGGETLLKEYFIFMVMLRRNGTKIDSGIKPLRTSPTVSAADILSFSKLYKNPQRIGEYL